VNSSPIPIYAFKLQSKIEIISQGEVSILVMKKVCLLIGFDQNESEMASIRWLRFKKYLEKDNLSIEWIPIKLSSLEKGESFIKKISHDISVLNKAYKLSKKLKNKINFNENTFVLVSIPPGDPLIVGIILKLLLRHKISMILEIRDIYARTDFFNFERGRRIIEVIKEKVFIRLADRILYLTEVIKKEYCSYYKNLNKVNEGIVITNGYDRDEYLYSKKGKKRNEYLEINYFGSIYGTRNPEVLFKALKKLKDDDKSNLKKIKINIFGKAKDYPIESKINYYELDDIVTFHGEKSHTFVLRKYFDTDINLIITHSKDSYYALPGKLFEYIGSGKPIWAITQDKILIDFLVRNELGFVSAQSIEEIIKTLEKIISMHKNRCLPSIEIPKKFDVREIVKELEKVFS